MAEETPEAASDAPAPVEEPPLIEVESNEESSGSDDIDLNDLFGDEQEVDLRLKGLAEAQEDTPVAVFTESTGEPVVDIMLDREADSVALTWVFQHWGRLPTESRAMPPPG